MSTHFNLHKSYSTDAEEVVLSYVAFSCTNVPALFDEKRALTYLGLALSTTRVEGKNNNHQEAKAIVTLL